MTDGITNDMPRGEYDATTALNYSKLKWFQVSPKHAQAALMGTLEASESDALRDGSALHEALLEPDVFATKWTRGGQCAAVLGSGSNAGTRCSNAGKSLTSDGWVCGQHARAYGLADLTTPEHFLPPERYDQIVATVAAVRADSYVTLLRSRGWNEATIEWSFAGLNFKSRLDRYSPAAPGRSAMVLDVKTIGFPPTDEACAKAIAERGYHRQMAMYAQAVEVTSGHFPECVLLFVETRPPYDINVIPLDTQTISIGWREVEYWIRDYKACREQYGDNPWPGVMQHAYSYETRQIKYGGLPAWYRKRYAMDEHIEIDPDQSVRIL